MAFKPSYAVNLSLESQSQQPVPGDPTIPAFFIIPCHLFEMYFFNTVAHFLFLSDV